MSMKDDIPDPPNGFSFSNGAFIGHTLVSRDPEDKPRMGMAKRIDDWMPFSVDLRPINSIKQYGFLPNEALCTALYANGTFVGVINAPYDAVNPVWVKVRSVFDEKP